MKSFVLSCGAVAWASRSGESTDLLQVDVQKTLSAGTMTMDMLQNVKEEVLNMVNVPADARTHLTTIEELLTNQVLPSLEAENNGDVQAHDEQYALFNTYASNHEGNLGGLSGSADAVTAAQGGHSICRGDEAGLYAAKTTCDGEEASALGVYNAARSSFDGAGATLGMHGDQHCDVSGSDAWIAGSRTDFDAYKSLFDTAAADYRSFNDKHVECNGRTGALNEKIGECNGLQTAYENAACSYAVEFKEEQGAYKLQYDTHAEGYVSSSGAWTAASANRRKQCALVQTVTCYIRALNANNEEDALTGAISTCDATDYETDCQGYGFTPSAAPDMAPLSPLPLVCDDAGFAYFTDAAPAGAPLAACNSCIAMHPVDAADGKF